MFGPQGFEDLMVSGQACFFCHVAMPGGCIQHQLSFPKQFTVGFSLRKKERLAAICSGSIRACPPCVRHVRRSPLCLLWPRLLISCLCPPWAAPSNHVGHAPRVRHVSGQVPALFPPSFDALLNARRRRVPVEAPLGAWRGAARRLWRRCSVPVEPPLVDNIIRNSIENKKARRPFNGKVIPTKICLCMQI